MVQETLLSVGLDGPFGIVVAGGAENGQFCWIEHVDATNIVFFNGKLHCDEVILEIQGQKVAGYTLQDLQEWLLLATNNNSPVLIKTVVAGREGVSFLCLFLCPGSSVCLSRALSVVDKLF